MDKNRLWMLGSVLVMAAVLVLGVLLGIQPQLAAVTAADDARTSVEASNAGQAAVLAKLKSDFEGIGKLKADLVPLQASVPTGTEMPAFVNQLNSLAGTAQVTFTGMTVANAQPYTPMLPPVAPVAAGAATTPAPTPPPGAVAPLAASTAGVPPVTSPLITTGNFASMALQISVTGSYGNVLTFVNGLQTGKRLLLVSGLTTAPADTPGIVKATISGLVYVLVPPATNTPTAAK
jgi:Tfp pilus assembly protein PilO